MAAVIAVLQRADLLCSAPSPSLSRALSGHDNTQYTIDEGLTGKTRRHAIKEAAKEAMQVKKAKKAKEGVVIEEVEEREESAV